MHVTSAQPYDFFHLDDNLTTLFLNEKMYMHNREVIYVSILLPCSPFFVHSLYKKTWLLSMAQAAPHLQRAQNKTLKHRTTQVRRLDAHGSDGRGRGVPLAVQPLLQSLRRGGPRHCLRVVELPHRRGEPAPDGSPPDGDRHQRKNLRLAQVMFFCLLSSFWAFRLIFIFLRRLGQSCSWSAIAVNGHECDDIRSVL